MGVFEKNVISNNTLMFLDLESTIFREDINKDVSQTAQCNQGGVSKCRAVTVNSDLLVNQLRIGESVKFLPGINLSMKLRRPPTGSVSNTLSYSFSLSDGGEVSLTIRPRSNSVFASIRPITGSVHYSVESCGSNCNVLYERDINYFNQFQDYNQPIQISTDYCFCIFISLI